MPQSQCVVAPACVQVQLFNFGKDQLDKVQMDLRLSLDKRRFLLARDGSSVSVELYDTDVVGVVRTKIQAIVDSAFASNDFAVTPCIR